MKEISFFIEAAIRHHNTSLRLEQTHTFDDVRNAIRRVMRDNPDIFWFAHQYHYDEASSTIHFQYTFSPERVKTIQQGINNVIKNDFCNEYVKKLTPQEQVTYVYKWLVTYCNYNANSAYNQSIYSVFVRRNSVCTGYAKAAQYLFNLLGIESRLVFGRLNNDKEYGRHCWNLIKVDNKYYHFDACFGDCILDNAAIKSGVKELFKINGVNYNFLCVSTDEILRTRSIEDITSLPECINSWHKTFIKSLAKTKLQQKGRIRGCLLSHIGSSADIYLCAKDKNTVLKVFRSDSKTTSSAEYHYMQQTKGCRHILQCNEQYTDITQYTIAIEQSTPIVDLLCSHYYELSLKGLIKMATDIATAWKECQERGVLYRDIHICNIYRSNDGTFKLGDFGSCTNDFDIKETVGNQWFMAPETFMSGIFTETSAVYSISMVMYFILNNLRPAFWAQGYEDKALQKRMNGDNLPIPAGCINLPPHIKTKLDEFFRKVSAVLPKERICSIAEFTYELERLTFYCEDSDYIIHHKGFSFGFNLNARNDDRLAARENYIPRDAYHRYAMGDDIEEMCTSDAKPILTSACTHDIVPDEDDEVEKIAIPGEELICEYVSAIAPDGASDDEVEGFAITGEEWNDECDLAIVPDDEIISAEFADDEVEGFAITGEGWNDECDSVIVPDDEIISVDEIEGFARTRGGWNDECDSVIVPDDIIISVDKVEGFARTKGGVRSILFEPLREIFGGIARFFSSSTIKSSNDVIIDEQNKYNEVYSSIFAPAEVKRKSHLQVQVYLHLYEESEKIKSLAQESDKNAERRGYIPLSLKLKKGDKVDVEFNVYGETRLASERKSIIWQGAFTKCSFDYFVPKDLDVDELSCEANLFVNGAMIGEMRFITKIVDAPRNLNSEILSHRFNRIFISYAHQDADQIKLLALAYKAQGVDYFYDRDSLAPGDVYEEKIFDYIDSSDLFVLCWSKNAAASDYVAKEKGRALLRAYPHLSQRDATLKIYPISIEPRADLPSDMKKVYNFEVI